MKEVSRREGASDLDRLKGQIQFAYAACFSGRHGHCLLVYLSGEQLITRARSFRLEYFDQGVERDNFLFLSAAIPFFRFRKPEAELHIHSPRIDDDSRA